MVSGKASAVLALSGATLSRFESALPRVRRHYSLIPQSRILLFEKAEPTRLIAEWLGEFTEIAVRVAQSGPLYV
jgi:hypothetical protein